MRQASVIKFLNSITAKFSQYKHTKASKLKKFKYLDENKLKEMFILDINEKITGAISEKKRYGWIFYFSSINELSVLYKLDKIIAGLFERLDDFHGTPPSSLKKLSRAYFEAKYSPTSGYIYNYDNNDTLESKRNFLSKRGKLDPNKGYSEEEIIELYDKVKQRNLSELQKDDAFVY
ncbi:hypothetical protein K9N68_19850 [Kovacikia minuta CCNUW1]|uniref:hypothetical protein n=1 Tax=Kovacikia minuta TaxID=2931930 RepID=UPI001CCF2A35|nr:hypothetical protein [Kovacikia minuta]UBF23982.1 hypothetical protein K9N68_19850 [Kovacikia minuta CCNUW1]